MLSRGYALVTGGARRIGAALCLAAAQAGHDVAIHHRASGEEAEALAARIRALGVNAVTLQADLADPGAAERLIAALPAPATLLVNCASRFDDDRVGNLEPSNWAATLAANLTAPVFLAQAFAAALPAGSEGLIVNITDQRVWRLNPQFFSYTISKAALWTATQTLAQALAPRIRVNAIGPGPVLPSVHQAPGEFEAEAAAVPLGRAGTVEQVGAALRYLIAAPSVTGQMIAIDGGQHLAWKTPDIIGA